MKIQIHLVGLSFGGLVACACFIGLFDIFIEVDSSPAWIKIPSAILFAAISIFSGVSVYKQFIRIKLPEQSK